MIDYAEFDKVNSQFKFLVDTDFATAFDLKKKSASLQHYFGEKLSEIEKANAKALRDGDYKKASIYREYREKYKTTDARELYVSDPEVKNCYDKYDDLNEIRSKLVAIIKYLDKIYYICQEITERGARRYGKDS